MSIPERLYKMGVTTEEDVLRRFSKQLNPRVKCDGVPLSRDYTVRPLWSRWVKRETAQEAEKWFATQYPKNFFCKQQYNGITECRDWTVAESFNFQKLLDTEYKKTPEYFDLVKTLSARQLIDRGYVKLYYVMLTRKEITAANTIYSKGE